MQSCLNQVNIFHFNTIYKILKIYNLFKVQMYQLNKELELMYLYFNKIPILLYFWTIKWH